jgi:acetylornithine deacetylase/succinyl-diaminopimelate desuccinylase-like protein
MAEIEDILKTIKEETPNFNATARSPYDMLPLETTESEPIVHIAQQALAEKTGTRAPVIGVPYWTDGAVLSQLGSIPTCLFGPGDIAVAHSANEYVEIRDVLRASEVYRSVIMNHCS